jgi:maltose alpha-D-glucosyltransferase/alpha-amylase
LLARVDYAEGDPDTYVMTLGFATGERANHLLEYERHQVVARARIKGDEGVLHGAFGERGLSLALLDLVARRRTLRGQAGEVAGLPGRFFKRLRGGEPLEPAPLRAEQSNSSVLFGDRMILKVFRRIDGGVNPDIEISRFLTEEAGFAHVPRVAGTVEYRPRKGTPVSLGIVQECVPNEGDAWSFTLDALDQYYERILVIPMERRTPPRADGASLLALARHATPPEAQGPIGAYSQAAWLLGRRTAEMHVALASGTEDTAFTPEPFTSLYQRSLYQSMRTLTEKTFALLRRRLRALPESLEPAAERLAARQDEVLDHFRTLLDRKIGALRTRVHGDYRLGQVLRSGADFIIIDFEGEPSLPLSTRRLKRSPLHDTAGMVRSLHYAAHHGLHSMEERGAIRPEGRSSLEPWAEHWFLWVSAAFLRGYLGTESVARLLPGDGEELEGLLNIFVLGKAIHELGYELNNRPRWVHLPLAGIQQLLEWEVP